MAMTPRSWSDLGLARRYIRSDKDMNKLLGCTRRFVKWVDSTHGEVINAILEHDGEKWTVTIYVQQDS